MGHVQYIRGRLFAWLLDLKDSKFVVGYAGTELDIALERGEIDARAVAVDTVSMSEAYKKLVDFHAILEIPKGHRPRQFVNLPEIEAFVRSDREPSSNHVAGFLGSRNAGLSPQARQRISPRYSGKPFAGLTKTVSFTNSTKNFLVFIQRHSCRKSSRSLSRSYRGIMRSSEFLKPSLNGSSSTAQVRSSFATTHRLANAVY